MKSTYTTEGEWKSGTFQFLDLYSTNQILSSSIMASSIVLNQILLLCPFHQVLVSWEQMSFSFDSTYHLLFSVIMYCLFYRQLTITRNDEETNLVCYVTNIITTKSIKWKRERGCGRSKTRLIHLYINVSGLHHRYHVKYHRTHGGILP